MQTQKSNDQTDTTMQPELMPTRLIDIHVYDIPLEEAPQCVEGQLVERGEEPRGPEAWQEQAKPLKNRPLTRLSPRFLGLLALLVLMITGSLISYVLFLPTATVTVVPKSLQIQTTGTLTVVGGRSVRAEDEVPGRMLAPITMSQTQTITTTGRTSRPARPGRGTITFYNAALYPQMLVAGTWLTGSSGREVVTDQEVIVPAATYPTFGSASVSAHAVELGPEGNIKAGDIYGSCCLLHIQAVSSTFHGGEAAQDYQSVSEADLERAEASLKAKLTQTVTAAAQTQVHSSETLLTPLPCLPSVSADHGVGDRATSLQVTVTHSCTGGAYETQSFRQRITHMQTQEALQHQIEHYRLAGEAQAAIQTATPDPASGSYRLSVQSRGRWVYQFSQAELRHLAASVVGKPTKQATRLLLQASGVQDVSLGNLGATLPSDPQKIHFLFVQR